MRTFFKLCVVLCVCLSRDDNVTAIRPRILKADGTEINYFTNINILYGDSLELYCEGQARQTLIMCKDNIMFDTTTVNETTIRFFDEKPEKRLSLVYCHYANGHDSTNIAAVRVLVDTLPKTSNFRCYFNYKSHSCTWTTPNVIVYKFSLYLVKGNVNSLLCNVMQYQAMYCVWDTNRLLMDGKPFAKSLTFEMRTYNHYGCGYQTFEVNHLAAIKSAPPEQLTLLWKRSHSVSISWKIPKNLKSIRLDHKITYWYSGINPRLVQTSSVFKQDDYHVIKLELPCEDTFYEVRVSLKPHEAEREEYCSDDAVLTFVTDPTPEDVDAVLDPTCVQPVPLGKITPEVMLYKIDRLKKKIKDEQNRVKERIKLFGLKVNELEGT